MRASLQHVSIKTALVCAMAVFSGCGKGDAPQPPTSETLARFTLQNGIRVIVQPVRNADDVGIEMIYRGGFLKEPEGYPQLAHLAEHLACKAATGKYRAGESWKKLSDIGYANAETMPTFSHYDYVVPATELETVLSIEADRLRDLRVDQAVIDRESEYCYSEIRALSEDEKAPLVKFAMMVANQNWRYGARDGQILAGLEAIPIEGIAKFFSDNYHVSNLTIIIVGAVSADYAKGLVEKQFGDLPVRKPAAAPPVRWQALPEVGRMTWDSDVTGVLLCYEPPESFTEQLIMSLWGNLIGQSLRSDIELTTVTRFVTASSYTWPVGELPFFVYASAGPNYSGQQVYQALRDRLERLTRILTSEEHATYIKSYVQQLSERGAYDPARARSQQRAVEQQFGLPPDEAFGQVLLQYALNIGIGDVFFEGQIEQHAPLLQTLSGEQLADVVQGVITPTRQRALILTPANSVR